jgi:hypothetical protein
MKNSQWIGVAACLVLVAVCFGPWVWIPDLQVNFTGFFSEENRYGRPGKILIFFSIVSIILFLVPRIWAKRFNVLSGTLMLAFGIRCYFVFTACYMGICPEKKLGIFLVVLLPVIVMVTAILPDMKLREK